MRSHCGRLLVACLALFVFEAYSSAADPPVSLHGSVLDTEGAVIVNAYVLVHPDSFGMMNGDQPRTLTLSSNKLGQFEVALEPGFYDVCVMSSAFTPECRKIRVLAGHSPEMRFKLKVSPEVTKEID